MVDNTTPLDIFADASGKARGRILLARDNAEMLSRDFVAYVDLGADDNVRVGDKLTVFRKLGTGNLMDYPKKESVSARDMDYASDEYRGGRFSNQAGRKKGDKARGRMVTTDAAKKGRPDLRKIVGEAVVLNVKERTATVIITRTAGEIHTGDWVEIQ